MNVYKVTFTLADGSTVNAELVTDMTLQTDYWTLTPSANGTEYSGFPSGNVGTTPTWNVTIPNYVNQSTSLSINILTTYVTPVVGTTLAVNGTLPTGWAFNTSTNLLTYNGVGVGGPNTISFTATYTSSGDTSQSNQFSVSGIGSVGADVTAPTIPLGVSASAITQTTATLSGFAASDPALSAATWSGLAYYTVLISGAPGNPYTVASTLGNEPILTFGDIGPQTSTITQSGSNITFTTTAVDNPYPTSSSLAAAYQQLTGSSWVLSCQIPATFTSTGAYDNLRLEARTNLTTTGPYVAIACDNLAGSHPVVSSEARASTGQSAVNIATSANTTGPVWLFMTRSVDTYSFYWSIDGNTLQNLGTTTQVMGNPLYVVAGANTSAGGPMTAQTMNQVNFQTNTNWSLPLTGLSANTTYPVTVSAKDGAGNVSAANSSFSFTTAGGGGGGSLPGFPLSGWVMSNAAYNSPAVYQQMAKYNFVYVNDYLGIEQSMGTAWQSIVNSIESYQQTINNSFFEIFLYHKENEAYNNAATGGFPGNTGNVILSALNAYPQWWLTNTWPSLTYIGYDANQYCVNVSDATPVYNFPTVGSVTGPGNVNFMQFWAWVQYIQCTVGSGNSSGFGGANKPVLNSSDPPTAPANNINFWHDNWVAQPQRAGNWACNSTLYAQYDTTIADSMARGYKQFITMAKSLNSTAKHMVNCNNLTSSPGSSYYPPASQGLFDYPFTEWWGGYWEPYRYTNFAAMLASFAQFSSLAVSGGVCAANFEGPGNNISGTGGAPGTGSQVNWTTAQSSWNAVDFQAFRYQAGVTTFAGWIAMISTLSSGGTNWWFDEFDAGIGTYNWLGAQTVAPRPWSNGVWRADYTHGSILVNPKGNGSQTVNMPYSGHFIQHTANHSDATYNTGAAFTTATTRPLNDRDAIFIKNT